MKIVKWWIWFPVSLFVHTARTKSVVDSMSFKNNTFKDNASEHREIKADKSSRFILKNGSINLHGLVGQDENASRDEGCSHSC